MRVRRAVRAALVPAAVALAVAWSPALPREAAAQDFTPPSTPSGLTGAAVSSSRIDLTWDAASDPQSGISEYLIYRDGNRVGSSTQTSYSDTGLQPDTRYTYRVSAVNGVGIEGGLSQRESVRTLPLQPPPSPENLVAQALSPNRIDLAWSAPNAGGITGYRVYRDGSFRAATPATAYEDTGLAPATTYQYRVTAVDTAGLESAPSDPASARTPDATPPTVPQNLSATPASTSRIDLSWSASSDPETGVASYRVFRDGSLVGTSGGTSFEDQGLQPSTTYEYRVSAVNEDGLESDRSAPALGTTRDATPPTTPEDLVAEAASTQQINLAWSAAADPESGVSAYRVYRDGAGLVGASAVTTFQDSGLEQNTVYTYRVSALNGDGLEGDRSQPASARTLEDIDPTPPSAPTNLNAQGASPSQINLSWSPASDPESGVSLYRVYRGDLQVGSTAGVSFSDIGLQPSTSYTYRVSAVNGDGLEGDRSGPATATTLAAPDSTPPTVPTNLAATPVSQTQIDLTWTAATDPESGVFSYRVYRGGDLIGNAGGTTFSNTGLAPGSTYSFKVSAVNGEGLEGEESAPAFGTTFPPTDQIPPAAPTGLRMVGP